jgi:hypothetical protein
VNFFSSIREYSDRSVLPELTNDFLSPFGFSHPNTHTYRLLIFKEHLLISHQHRSEIMTHFDHLVKHLRNLCFDHLEASQHDQVMPPTQANTTITVNAKQRRRSPHLRRRGPVH